MEVSDCEELMWYLIEHLGRNDTSYFMYLWAGPVDSPSPKYPQMQANIKGLLRTIKVLIFIDNKGFNECYRILLEFVVAEMYRKRLLAIKF